MPQQSGASGGEANGTSSHDEEGGHGGEGEAAATWCYDAVAVGGTFDRLHGALVVV